MADLAGTLAAPAATPDTARSQDAGARRAAGEPLAAEPALTPPGPASPLARQLAQVIWPQRKPGAVSAPGRLPASVTQAVGSSGGGRRLDSATRIAMEPAFGTDLSGVRLHSDRRAAQAARDIDAYAFTHGEDIFFGAGQFRPATTDGHRLLAHELAHVMQQRDSGGAQLQPYASVEVSRPGDRCEREADRIADDAVRGRPPAIGKAQVRRVLRMTKPDSAMTSAAGGVAGNGASNSVIKRKQCHCDAASGSSDMCAECAEQQSAVQRDPIQASGPSHLPPSVTQAIQGGGGDRLPEANRAHMESAFGADLSGVRIHRDPDAAHAANDISARAFTVGQEIYSGAGQYDPGTKQGNRLLAHELTHTLQQASGAVTAQADTPISSPADPLEREAEAVAASIGNPSPQQPLRPGLTTPPMVQGAWYDFAVGAAEWVGARSRPAPVPHGEGRSGSGARSRKARSS